MNVNYFSRLAIKKIQIKLHNTFEKRKRSTSTIDFDSFYFFLIKETLGNLHFTEKGIFYKTKINQNQLPVVTSHSRLISLLCDGFDVEYFPVKNKYLIEKLADFLITLKNKDNLFNFNKHKWDKQDEGIASVWAAIALIKSYDIIKKDVYLNETLSIYNAILKKLYTLESGLVHTAGQDFWCTNASSKFAYLCSLILKYNYSDQIKDVMINSIKICTQNIGEDGHYPYTKKHMGVYILLYHPSVIFYLNNCLVSEYINNKLKEEIQETNRKALCFLLKCLDSSGRFHEPELKKYNFYLISIVTALAAIKNEIEKTKEYKVLNNILKYYNNNELYMFINENNLLFNGYMYKIRDVLTVETLYWLTQYIWKR